MRLARSAVTLSSVAGDCRGCHGPGLRSILDLGRQPHAGVFPATADESSDQVWPLILARCPHCGLFQLSGEAPLEPDSEGAPAPTSSATMERHVEAMVDELMAAGLLGHGERVVDLASHGGHVAPFLARRGVHALVLETVPWRIAELRMAQHEVMPIAPESPGAAAIAGSADVVIDLYRLAHLPDLDAGVAAIAALLRPGGTAVIEFDHALSTIAETQFDAIRHGHFSYLTLAALDPVLHRHGLAITHAARSPVYGGALRLVLRHAAGLAEDPSAVEIRSAEEDAGLSDERTLEAMSGVVKARSDALYDHLATAAARGQTVVGYGAPTRAGTLLNTARVTIRELPYTVDRAIMKQGRFLPGSRIPILAPAVLSAAPPDEILILTWDIAREVVDQLAALAPTTRFVVPLPELAAITRPTAGLRSP